MTREPIIDTAANTERLSGRIAEWLIGRMAASTGPFALSLSGGSTPRGLYALLGSPAYRNRISWQRLHLFWGDERFVPPDHPDSNYRMAREAMIAHVPIPSYQVHPIPTSASPQEGAAAYQRTLREFYQAGVLDPERPLFDVTLLGVGPDGHTASLFPGTPALDEQTAWVVPVLGTKPEARITLTFPAIASGRAVAFLATGAEKHPIIARMRRGDQALPAARVQPAGELRWFLDRAAAGGKED